MEQEADFEEIRPFQDEEVPAVVEQLSKEPYFKRMLPALFPNKEVDDIIADLKTIKTIDEFQTHFILPFLNMIVETTTDGLSASGLDKLSKEGGYLFITNHRDIVLDSALLNVKLREVGLETTEIGIGDNLLIYSWITDLVKLNKSFIVKRGLPGRQMMDASETLSSFIRQSISEKHNIWLAQREGRSKDGSDKTQSSVLKMLNLSGQSSPRENLKALHIVPVSISYEFDPCDAMKAYQICQANENPDYKKSKDEDLRHMNNGIMGHKGHVHFSFGSPIDTEIDAIDADNKNAQINAIVDIIDKHIHQNYKLFPSAFVAYDILENTNKYANEYTNEDKENFIKYIDHKISELPDHSSPNLRSTVLRMYANPVYSKENL